MVVVAVVSHKGLLLSFTIVLSTVFRCCTMRSQLPASTLTLTENQLPNVVLYSATVENEDVNQTQIFSLVRGYHPTNGSGFQIDSETGNVTLGPMQYWPDGQQRNPLSYEDGMAAACQAHRVTRLAFLLLHG